MHKDSAGRFDDTFLLRVSAPPAQSFYLTENEVLWEIKKAFPKPYWNLEML